MKDDFRGRKKILISRITLTFLPAAAIIMSVCLFSSGLSAAQNGTSLAAATTSPAIMTTIDKSGPPYPRLGMWWLDPYNASVKEIANYDLLLNEFEGEGMKEKLAQVRSKNPDIKVFRPLSPSERCLFWEWDGEQIPNPEIKDLPTSFFLLQVGANLTKPLTKTDTRIYVREMYYSNGTPIFHIGGDVAIGASESAHVTAIDYKKKMLTVERGYVRAAAAHKTGEYVAPHIRFWPGSWVMNVTADCPKIRVKGVSEPVNWTGYFYSLTAGSAKEIYPVPWSNDNYIDHKNLRYDGIILDRFEDYESWLMWDEEGREIEIDLLHNGKSASAEVIDKSWRKGTDQLLNLLRSKYPGLPVIRNNPITTRYAMYDGQVFETSGWTEPSSEWWESLFITTDPDEYYRTGCYLDWFRNGTKPWVMLEVYEDEAGQAADGDGNYDNPYLKKGFVPNYQRMRFSLASALLGDGYYSYEINTNGHGSLGLMWFDEYDNAGKGKGYLGYPKGKCQRLSSGIYKREFDNGLVLVNPQPRAVTIKLDQKYVKIKGKQAPAVNDGKRTDTVRLKGFDGLILLKPEK